MSLVCLKKKIIIIILGTTDRMWSRALATIRIVRVIFFHINARNLQLETF